MTIRKLKFKTALRWSGADASTLSGDTPNSKDFEITSPGKPAIPGSADLAFSGDSSRWNPEELMLASLSACHQLWYLALCARERVELQSYEDKPEGTLEQSGMGSGKFTEILLRPKITILDRSRMNTAIRLHDEVQSLCFIGNTLNCSILVEPDTICANCEG